MENVSQEIISFIETNITEMSIPVVKESLDILGKYSYPDLEEKLLNIIYQEENPDSYNKTSNFVQVISNMLFDVIRVHGLKMSECNSPTLRQLNQIAHTFIKVLELETFEHLLSILNDPTFDNKNKFANIANTLTSIEWIVCMDLIDDVSDDLIESINQLSITWLETKDIDLEVIVNDLPKLFISYLGENDCIGKRLYNEGFSNPITLTDLISILPYNVHGYLDDKGKIGLTFLALELLSLFMITRDASIEPITVLKERSEEFVADPVNIPTVISIFSDMYNDFMIFKKDMEKGIKHEENE